MSTEREVFRMKFIQNLVVGVQEDFTVPHLNECG